ncbi:putative RNA methyltransferase [Pseudohyphozyma bogoriensis]|nr:putative RNA methyltransferase [Pseudohyphozyma bogoriensis]
MARGAQTAAFCSPAVLEIVINLETGTRPPATAHIRYALAVSAGMACLLFLLAVGAFIVRILHKETLNPFSKKNGYWCVKPSLIGNLMVAIYSLLALAIKRAFTMRPVLVNSISVIVPVLVLAANVVGLSTWLMSRADGMKSEAMSTMIHYGPTPTALEWAPAVASCRTADSIYRAIWGVWSILFGSCVLVYLFYTYLLNQLLVRQISFLDVEPSLASSPTTGKLSVRKERLAQQVASTRALKELRDNVRFRKFEALACCAYCSPWTSVLVIGIYKAVVGFRIFLSVKIWGTLLALEIMLATLCIGLNLALSTYRGIAIYKVKGRVGRRSSSSGPGGGNPGTQVHITVETQIETWDVVEEDKIETSALDPTIYDFPDVSQIPTTPALTPIRVRLPSVASLCDCPEGDQSPMAPGVDNWEGEGSPHMWSAPSEWGMSSPCAKGVHFPELQKPEKARRRSSEVTQSGLARSRSLQDLQLFKGGK